MAIEVISSRTKRRYLRPPRGPFCLNRDAEAAQGLRFWAPLGEVTPASYHDYAGHLTMTAGAGAASPTVGAAFRPAGGYAANFVSGSSQYLEHTAPPVTARPLSIGAWYIPVTGSDGALVSIVNNAATDNYFELKLNSTTASMVKRNTTFTEAASAGAFTAGQLGHALGVCPAANGFSCYRDGGNVGTASSADVPSSLNRISIGALRRSSPADFISAKIFEVMVWDRELSAAHAWLLFDPKTRWAHYHTLRKVLWSFPDVGGAAPPTGNRRRRVLMCAGR